MAVDQRALPGANFKVGFVEADGFRIRYREQGTGEPLVCFHGAGGLRVSYAHEILSERYRVITFEAPGFGESPANDRSATIKELASTMARAVAALGIEQCHMMGTSFGGRLGLWLAIQHPDRVKSLVLVSPAAIAPDAPSMVAASPSRGDMLVAHPERRPPSPPMDPAVDAIQSALVRRLAGPPRAETEAAMATLDVPVLVLFGTEDRMFPTTMGRIYREKLPRSNFILVYDAGHAMDIDRPEAVASIVGDFLARGESFIVKQESALINP
jgi:pimeloyl-ACP methyl ester carboxylesterase